jgi:DNA-binding winged helix-turn-helix (wHTH) protein
MSLQLDSAVGERLKFGEFELAPVARALWRRGEPVKLGSRAFDILIALASRPGQILSKDDLTRLVWRGAFAARWFAAAQCSPFTAHRQPTLRAE